VVLSCDIEEVVRIAKELVKACAGPLEAIHCYVGFEVYDLGLDVAKKLV